MSKAPKRLTATKHQQETEAEEYFAKTDLSNGEIYSNIGLPGLRAFLIGFDHPFASTSTKTKQLLKNTVESMLLQ